MLILTFVLRLDILSNIKLSINTVFADLFPVTRAMPAVHFSLLNMTVLTIVGADYFTMQLTLLKTKRRPLYLKTQSVPRCKHFSSRL